MAAPAMGGDEKLPIKMLSDRLLMFALLLPFAMGGLYVGNRLQGRISREQLVRFISVLVLLIGTSVLFRALA